MDLIRRVISKTKIEQMRKLYVDKDRKMEMLSGEELGLKEIEEGEKVGEDAQTAISSDREPAEAGR